MKTFIFIVFGLVVTFYLFFYISGLVIINKTRNIAKEKGWTIEDERKHQRIIEEWREQEEKTKDEEFRRSMKYED